MSTTWRYSPPYEDAFLERTEKMIPSQTIVDLDLSLQLGHSR